MKLYWTIRKQFAEKRLRKLMKQHPEKRNHSVEVRLEQEIARCDLALEWSDELKQTYHES